MKKRTVSIKRTVWEIFLMTLLNVPYDPKIKTIIALSYRTYNRVFRVHSDYKIVNKCFKDGLKDGSIVKKGSIFLVRTL